MGRQLKVQSDARINLRLPVDLLERTERFVAARQGSGFSALVCSLLELHLEGNEGIKPKLSLPYGVLPQYPKAPRG